MVDYSIVILVTILGFPDCATGSKIHVHDRTEEWEDVGSGMT